MPSRSGTQNLARFRSIRTVFCAKDAQPEEQPTDQEKRHLEGGSELCSAEYTSYTTDRLKFTDLLVERLDETSPVWFERPGVHG